jgi:hypothetical protein
MIKKLAILGLLLALVGGSVGYYLFNKPHEDMAVKKSDAQLTAAQLRSNFESNKNKAESDYLTKIIEVSGKIKEVSADTSGTTLLLEAGSESSAVSCTLDKFSQQKKTIFNIGEDVRLKGICIGQTMFDIQLDRCVVLE